MKFNDKLPEYSIDMDASEADRWKPVIEIKAERRAATTLARRAAKGPGFLRRLAALVFEALYRAVEGPYQEEMKAWADAMELSTGEVMMLNCAYELSHKFGCTAGVRKLGSTMLHVRNLDWEVSGLGAGTRIFNFCRAGAVEFTSVGFLGFVGVLSGMRPGAYSVTINWAPPEGAPDPDYYGPAFLLRKTLETETTFAGAVKRLRTKPLAAGAFFTVCGTADGEGCVIERTQRKSEVRWIGKDAVLVQANHYVKKKFASYNAQMEEDLEDSRRRAEGLADGLARAQSVADATAILKRKDAKRPVLNKDTCQGMVFVPADRRVTAWAVRR